MHADFRSRHAYQIKEKCPRESLLKVPVALDDMLLHLVSWRLGMIALQRHSFRFNIFSSPNCVLWGIDIVMDKSLKCLDIYMLNTDRQERNFKISKLADLC
ncbi:hypothetical protein CEXT_6351 [Caerostris extrusa]|uniref:Uncharacterized protein n=1 Tax=Caerostris extrusa TaxID=172846 RepID=A0AAV4PKF2_CAEEX|nr:hypothetical protein CEXT_6351 [Caerostris extrusa]